MPKFEDLPMPAQAEIRQARGDAEEEHPQKSKLSLLQRLANVGLGRRDEETEPPIAARASGLRWRRCRRCPIASRSVPSPSRWRRIRIRYQSTRSARRRKVWTPMAARHLLPRATGRRPS
jgi:cell division protein FtsZ